MAQSSRLTFVQIQEIFRIVLESIDLGNDPIAWRQRMLGRMCKLIDARWGISFVIPIKFDPQKLDPPVFAFSPISRAEERAYSKVMRSANVADDPLTPVIASLAHIPTTLTRRQMVDDEKWYQSESYKRWRKPANMDDLIHSHDPLPQFGVMSVLGFVRAIGEKPFGLREVKMVDVLREELRHRWLSLAADNAKRIPLTIRHQQLLGHLKGSMSEKQIANYMGLSPHTTHNYIKELYRRLQVNSRAQLLQQADRITSKAVLPKIGYGDV